MSNESVSWKGRATRSTVVHLTFAMWMTAAFLAGLLGGHHVVQSLIATA